MLLSAILGVVGHTSISWYNVMFSFFGVIHTQRIYFAPKLPILFHPPQKALPPPYKMGCRGAVGLQRRWCSLASTERRTRQINVRGVRFHVVEEGDPSLPGVFCMPGALGTAENDFGGQLRALSRRGYHVMSFDPRGYGASRPPVRTFTDDFYQVDADDVSAILTSLQKDRTNIMGWSDGANAAVLLAAKYPHQVEKLCIFGGNSFITQEDVDAYEMTRNVQASWSQGMKLKCNPVYGADLQPMWDSFCDAMQNIKSKGGDICQQEAKLIQCPTLIVHGDKDPIVPTSHAEWFANNIPNSQVYFFKEGKHNIHVKYADIFNGLVAQFFAQGPSHEGQLTN